MEVYVGVHVGTAEIHALSLAEDGRVLHNAHVATPVGSDGVGPVHEALALEQLVARAIDEAVGAVHGARLAALALTSFGDEGFFVDRAGKALYPAIAWYDRRSVRSQARWLDRHSDEEIYERTGLPVDLRRPFMKWLWMLERVPEVLKSAGTYLSVSEYLAYRWTGEQAAVASQAARTGVFDVTQDRYISDWIRDCELWKDAMPPLAPTGQVLGDLLGRALPGTGRTPRVPVILAGNDRAIAPLALGPGEPGAAVDLMNRTEWVSLPRESPLPDGSGLFWGLEFGPGALPHRHQVTGILRAERSLEAWERVLGRDREVLERMAERVAPGSQGIRFRPLGSPLPGPGSTEPPGSRRGDSPRRGDFLKLPLDVDAGVLWRAILEGWAFELRDTLAQMQGTLRPSLTAVQVLSESRISLLALRIRSSVLGVPIHVLEVPNAPALGAAVLAARGAGASWAQGNQQPKASRVLRIDPDREWVELYGGEAASEAHQESQPA